MLLTFSLLPLIIIVFLAFSYYSNTFKKETTLKYTNSVQRIENTISTVLEYYSTQMQTLFVYDESSIFFEAKKFEDIESTWRKLGIEVMTRCLIYKYTDSFYLYNGRIGLIGPNCFISKNMFDSTEQRYTNICIDNFNNIFQSKKSKYQELYAYAWKKETNTGIKNILGLIRPYLTSTNPKGAVFANIDIEALLGPIIRSYNMSDGVFIIWLGNEVLYSYNTNILKDADLQNAIYKTNINKEYVIQTVGKTDWLIATGKISDNGLNFKFLLPLNDIYSELLILRNRLVLMVLVSLLLLITLSFFITYKMYNPIDMLLRRLDDGSLHFGNNQFVAKDELSYISKTLERTLHEHELIEIELENRIQIFQKAQFIALQSQITPHFLCNTLDNINWMAIMHLGEDNIISDMVGKLTGLLRVSLESSTSVHSLAQEIEYAKQYISIMKTRYEDKFDVTWDIVQNIYNVKIPKIILQPIIENAIYHGIKILKIKGHIHISFSEHDNMLQIEISDNGIGFDDEQIEHINEELKNNYIKENSHIGILNVNLRLKLLFGEEYGLSVGKSKYGGGYVFIQIPK
jgi:Predicted signal transduction protein with a C-terminal ATPase domain